MKINYKILILSKVLLIVVSINSFCQSDFEYQYDGNGNRALRQLVASPNGRIAALEEVEEESTTAEEELSYAVDVYPNPGTGIYEVTIPQAGEEPVELRVFNLSGSLVYTNPNPSIQTSVNLKNQPTGIYLFKIKTNSASTVKKVLKE